jgi:hypothetical protein
MKKTIRLNESDLKKIIKETIKELLAPKDYYDSDVVCIFDLLHDDDEFNKWWDSLYNDYDNNIQSKKIVDLLENDDDYYDINIYITYIQYIPGCPGSYYTPPSPSDVEYNWESDVKKLQNILPDQIYKSLNDSLNDYVENEYMENYREKYIDDWENYEEEYDPCDRY